jgi:hypothetical protein
LSTNVVVLSMIAGGVFFTTFSVVAWTTGRHVGAMLLAVVAGTDFAFAASLLLRASGG